MFLWAINYILKVKCLPGCKQASHVAFTHTHAHTHTHMHSNTYTHVKDSIGQMAFDALNSINIHTYIYSCI